MAKFPEPPDVDALKSIPSQTVNLEAGEKIFRVFRTEGPYPVSWNTFRYFGPTSSRFDHHLHAGSNSSWKLWSVSLTLILN